VPSDSSGRVRRNRRIRRNDRSDGAILRSLEGISQGGKYYGESRVVSTRSEQEKVNLEPSQLDSAVDLTQVSGRGTDRARTDRRLSRDRRQQLSELSSSLGFDRVIGDYNFDEFQDKNLVAIAGASSSGSSGNKSSPVVTMPRNETARPGKRPLRSLSAQEKMEAIKRVHDGESKAAVARDIGVPESTLRGWCKSEHKIRSQARNLGNFEQQVSSPSDSDRSTGSSPPATSMQGSSGNIVQPVKDASNEESDVSGVAAKRVRLENGITSTATNNIASSAARLYNGDINGQFLSQCQALYNLIGNSEMNKNVFTMQDHVALLQKQNSLISLFSSATSPIPSTSSGVGLIENGLQYTRNNGVLTSNANKRKHSSCTDTTSRSASTRRQNSLSPAAEKCGSGSGSGSGSTSKSTKQDGKTLDQIAASLGVQQYMQQMQQQPGQTTVASMELLLQWYKTYNQFNAQLVHMPHMRNYLGRQVLENYICNNNNVHQNNNEGENVNANRAEVNCQPGLDEAIESGDLLANFLEEHGSARYTFNQVYQIRRIVEDMKNWAKTAKSDFERKRSNSTS